MLPATVSSAMSSSVQKFDAARVPRIALIQLASMAETVAAWPGLRRDLDLEKFWPTEPFLAGAIFSICSRNASFRWEITGPRDQAKWAQGLLSQADFGKGWQSLIMKLSQDLLTTGNGAFMEIIRPARARTKAGLWYDAINIHNPDTNMHEWVPFNRHSGKPMFGMKQGEDFSIQDSMLDLPTGLAHLDSFRCQRTGNPSYPVLYTDINGYEHILAHHQVAPLSEMPSTREDHLGYQRCAVDRVLRAAQIVLDTEIYKGEKISGRFTRAIHLTNIDADVIQDAVDQAGENNDNMGLLRYSQPVIAATLDPNAKASVETIELATIPDGFDEDASFRWYVAALAMGLGVDYGFLAPLPGNKLGTGSQAETADRQAKGKSSQLFISMIEQAMNWHGVLPCETSFRFNAPDPAEESERDRAFGRRARSLSILAKAGMITPEIGAQIAADFGDIDPQYLAQMGLADLTPIVTVSDNDKICDTRTFVPRVIPQIESDPVEETPAAPEGET